MIMLSLKAPQLKRLERNATPTIPLLNDFHPRKRNRRRSVEAPRDLPHHGTDTVAAHRQRCPWCTRSEGPSINCPSHTSQCTQAAPSPFEGNTDNLGFATTSRDPSVRTFCWSLVALPPQPAPDTQRCSSPLGTTSRAVPTAHGAHRILFFSEHPLEYRVRKSN